MCAVCGCDLRSLIFKNAQSDFQHNLSFLAKGLVVNSKSALKQIYETDQSLLEESKKLRLILDLDETILHSVVLKYNLETESMEGQEEMDLFASSPNLQTNLLLQQPPQQQNKPIKRVSSQNKNIDSQIFTSIMQSATTPTITQDPKTGLNFFYFTLQDFNPISDGIITVYKCFERPFLKNFLDSVSQNFEIYVYTNSTEAYASKILSILNIKTYVTGIFTRDLNNNYQVRQVSSKRTKASSPMKDLRNVLCKQTNTLVIDDRLDVWQDSNRVNVLKVSPFHAESAEDEELQHLASYLNKIHHYYFEYGYNDVRQVLQDYQKLEEEDAAEEDEDELMIDQ